MPTVIPAQAGIHAPFAHAKGARAQRAGYARGGRGATCPLRPSVRGRERSERGMPGAERGRQRRSPHHQNPAIPALPPSLLHPHRHSYTPTVIPAPLRHSCAGRNPRPFRSRERGASAASGVCPGRQGGPPTIPSPSMGEARVRVTERTRSDLPPSPQRKGARTQ